MMNFNNFDPLNSPFYVHAKACIELNDKEFLEWASRSGFIPDIHEARVCDKCNHGLLQLESYPIHCDKYGYRCDNCFTRKSIRLDSWISQKKQPIRVLYLLLACWCENCSLKETNRWLSQLDREIIKNIRSSLNQAHNVNQQLPLGTGKKANTIICRNTFYKYCIEFRAHAEKLYYQDLSNNPIGTVGHAIQIDESLFTKAKYNRGRNLNSTPMWFFGSIDPATHRISVEEVKHRDALTLIPIIISTILPGMTIYSDQWRAYTQLPNYGFPHYTVNHSVEFVNRSNPNFNVHTQLIENQWYCIKNFLRDKKSFRRITIASHIHEYCFRQNLGKSFELCWHYMNKD